MTGLIRLEVRGKDGQVLTPLEMEREKRLFESVPLVEICDKHSFYDDYKAGVNSSTDPDVVRLCAQISLIGRLFPRCGDAFLLQPLWNQVEVAANHQGLFLFFAWGPQL